GWFYVYLHVNNDTPGTDDGQATFEQAFVPGLAVGQRVSSCQPIAYMGDSGNAEGAGAHLHFEIRRPPSQDGRHRHWSSSEPINPQDSLLTASGRPLPASGTRALPAERWAPFDSAADLVDRQYRDF